MTDKQKQKEMTVQKFLDVAITYPGYFIEESSVRKGRYSWKTDAYSMFMKIKNILEKPPQYILGDGTVCCTYCGSVLGAEFDDNNEESIDEQVQLRIDRENES